MVGTPYPPDQHCLSPSHHPCPQATINQTKEDWNEVMEMQSFSPHLRMLLGEAFIMVTTKGKVGWSSLPIAPLTPLTYCR